LGWRFRHGQFRGDLSVETYLVLLRCVRLIFHLAMSALVNGPGPRYEATWSPGQLP
jgi:hypothetical protein